MDSVKIISFMYCKYCGQTNDDDDVFCSKCGKRLNNVTQKNTDQPTPTQQNVLSNDTKWLSTENLQWQSNNGTKTIMRILLSVSIFFFIWGVIWIAIGGNAKYKEYSGWSCIYRYNISEPFGIIDVDFTNRKDWKGFYINQKYTRDFEPKAKEMFRTFVSLAYCLPSLIFIILISVWLKNSKKDVNNNIPRDIADYIESYSIKGLNIHKYVIFIKDGKYGILDAIKHKVIVPAQYNKIRWRVPSKSYDKE